MDEAEIRRRLAASEAAGKTSPANEALRLILDLLDAERKRRPTELQRFWAEMLGRCESAIRQQQIAVTRADEAIRHADAGRERLIEILEMCRAACGLSNDETDANQPEKPQAPRAVA